MKLVRAVVLELAVRTWPWVKAAAWVALLLAAGWNTAAGALSVIR